MGTVLGFVLMALALGGAGYLVVKTNALQKRGCGGGCGTCGNRNFCHRREERLKQAKAQNPESRT